MNKSLPQLPMATSCDLTSEFLRGNVAEANVPLVEEHLGICQLCRDRLETESASSAFWSETRLMLAEPETRFTVPREKFDFASTLDPTLFSVAPHPSELPNRPTCEHEWSGRQLDLRGSGILSQWLDPASAPDAIGRLGKYEILQVLGQGGMGVVLEARDTELQRRVAIKTIGNLLADSDHHQRLIREARTIAAIRHPHILPIYGIDKWREIPVFVMPLVRGGTLQQAVAAGSLSIEQVLDVGIQVTKALVCLHAHGIVHRDLKPSNILLNDDLQNVVLSDFGLARTDGDYSLTASNVVVGTPHFMSPEQSRGERLDHRSDLFSLGSLLFWLCTGQLPFNGSSQFAIMNCVVSQSPDYHQLKNGVIPTSLQLVIQGLLAKNPERRWQSSGQVLELLETCRTTQSPSGVRSETPEAWVGGQDGAIAHGNSHGWSVQVRLAQKFPRRRPIFFLIGTTIAFLAAGLIVIESAKRSERGPFPENLQFAEANTEAPDLSPPAAPSIQLAFPEVRSERNLPLDELDRQVIIEELENGRNAIYWLRRLASLPVEELPAEVVPVVQKFANHPHPAAKHFAEVILQKNPFQSVESDQVVFPQAIEWYSTENPFVEIEVEEPQHD